MTVSSDDRHVYSVGFPDNEVAVFSRDLADGAFTFFERERVDVDGLAGACGVAVSPDGHHRWVAVAADDAVLLLERDAATGELIKQSLLPGEYNIVLDTRLEEWPLRRYFFRGDQCTRRGGLYQCEVATFLIVRSRTDRKNDWPGIPDPGRSPKRTILPEHASWF